MNRWRTHRPAAAGFTLIELLVVMGILTGFLLMLAQLVDGGVSMFREGEAGQALADRGANAQRVIARELATLRGAPAGGASDVVTDRLVVQSLPIGLPPRPERGATRVQVLRGAVRLLPDRERVLVDMRLATKVLSENPTWSQEAVDKRVAELRVHEPLRGVGNLLLLPWRQEGDDDALLELRAAWFLPGTQIPIGGDRFVDPFTVPVPGSEELPGVAVVRVTTPLLRDLLHVEFALWGQTTRGWGDDVTPANGGTRPYSVWDSARGGWLLDARAGGEFALDRGEASENDPRDDVQPHAILVRCAIAAPGDGAPEGVLYEAVHADDTSLRLYNGERFPGPVDGGWVKVRGEWMRYTERVGDELRGLQRGARATKAIDHPAGSRAHVGRTVEFVVPIPHAKDDWNG